MSPVFTLFTVYMLSSGKMDPTTAKTAAGGGIFKQSVFFLVFNMGNMNLTYQI